MNHPNVATIFQPNGDDWIVTMVLADRTIRTRRVTPGSIGREEAIASALRAQRVSRSDLVDLAAARVGSSARMEAIDRDDPFAALVRRLA